jgi:hypothetical protein
MQSIPPDIDTKLFPHPDLPVLEFLQFHIPIVQTSFRPTFKRTLREIFFDKQPPNITEIQSIMQAPSPPLVVVKGLQQDLPEAISSGFHSIRGIQTHPASTADRTYPLWIVAYWDRAFDVREVRDTWLAAEDRLRDRMRRYKAKGKSDSIRIVEQIFDALSVLQWGHKLSGFSPSATEPVVCLTVYTSQDWLKGEHANQMLDILATDLRRARKSSVQIGDTWFYEKITRGFKNPTSYATADSFRFYRDIGHDLATGTYNQFGFLANVNGNHWIAAVLDFPQRRIWYGDSLAQGSKSLEKRLGWWTKFHSGEVFTYEQLPITIQQDSFSCCFLAWNALAFFFRNDGDTREELVKAGEVADCRLRILLRILQEHLARKSLGSSLILNTPDLKSVSRKPPPVSIVPW